MAKNQEKDKGKEKTDLEEEVWSAISAFEQILEAMPNDRASLEALSHAYEQVGDHTRAKDYVLRLGNVLVSEADADAARELLSKIQSYADEDPHARELVSVIEELAPEQPVEIAPAEPGPKSADAAKVRTGFNMADELSFAWNLLEANKLSQEEYASVVQDLTEMSAEDRATTISVLHVLDGRGFKGLEKIVTFVSKECAVPIVALSSFDLQLEAVSVLPYDFMMRRGAILFDFLGKDALVVAMNPYDLQLRKDVEALAGKKCHFYISIPMEFDQALEKIKEILAENSASSD